jgi:hypothetical protein
MLAEEIARRNLLQPVTDDGDDYAITTGWTEEKIYSTLLPDLPNPTRKQDQGNSRKSPQVPIPVGLIAIQAIAPKDMHRIPIRKIIILREQYGTYFRSFRDAADTVAAEITSQLADVEDPAVIQAYIEQEVQDRLIVPTRELRRELSQMKVDTVTATLTSKYDMPALAGLVSAGMLAHQPLLAGGSAIALALLGRLRGTRAELRGRLAQSPVSYLMLMEDSLTPRTRLEKTIQQMRQITGSP